MVCVKVVSVLMFYDFIAACSSLIVCSLAMNMAQLHSRLQLIETKLKAEKKHLVDLQAEHHYQMEITEFLNPKLSKLEIEQKQLCR